MKYALTILTAYIVLAICAGTTLAADMITAEITVEAGEHDRVNVPVICGGLYVQSPTVRLEGNDGTTIAGQIYVPQPGSRSGKVTMRFVVPEITAGETQTYRFEIPRVRPRPSDSQQNQPPGFSWHDTAGESLELRFGKGDKDDRPVLRYMKRTYDGSTSESHELTKKVFHHVFDPGTGKQILTKGPGGLYSHHRGIFYGFSKLTYGEKGARKTADTWHCNNGESQRHAEIDADNAFLFPAHSAFRGFRPLLAGPVFAMQRAAITWHGTDGELFAREGRRITVYNIPGGTLLEFESRLVDTDGPLSIDGDPQHAGFQFRAAQEVAEKTKDQTYYLRPDGRGKPGETRNWDHKNIGQPSNKQTENLPWNAMSFVVGGKRYTAVYLDHPDNPKPARYSERDYGRFGSYFEDEDPGKREININRDLRIRPFQIRYRLWIKEGEMTVNEAQRLYHDFVDPPKATVRGVKADE